MLIGVIFWTIVALLLLLLATGAVLAFRRNGKAESQGSQPSPIYASGVYSLIRKSPRAEVLERAPDAEKVLEALRHLPKGAGPVPPEGPEGLGRLAARYREEWLRVAELSIHNIEKGDREGVQTYRYQVPEKCRGTCQAFGGDAYVTREQLHNHVQLIPPFHLGCGVELVGKDAWSPGGGNAGWTPILPVNGKYLTPDWRTVAKL